MDDPDFKKLEAMLLELQESKVPPSKQQIVNVTKQSLAAVRHFKHVVHAVEKFILKSKSSHKLHGFYMIDSIVRQSQKKFKHKDLFKPRFAANLKQTLENALKCPIKDRPKIVRVINLWRANNIFDEELLLSLLQYCRASGLSIDVEVVEKTVKGDNADLSLYKAINSDNSVKPSSSQSLTNINQQKESRNNTSSILVPQHVLIKNLSLISSEYQKALTNDPEVLRKVQELVTEKVKEKIDSESKNKIQNILSAGFDYSDEEDYDEDDNRASESTSKEKIEKFTETVLKESSIQSELRKIFLQQVSGYNNGRDDSKERKRRRSDSRDRRDSKDKRDKHRRSKDRSHKRSTSPRHREDKREKERRKLGWPLDPKREHFLISSRTIWLGKIPANCSESEIKTALTDIGTPEKINILNSRACAYVTMPDRRSAFKVVDRMAHKLEISRKPVRVSWSIGQGLNGNKELNVFWESDNGYHQIPWTLLKEPIDPYFEGSYADVDTLPKHLRGLYDEKGRKKVKTQEKIQQPPQPQPNISSALPEQIPMPLPENPVIPNVAQLPPGFPANIIPPGLKLPDGQDGNNPVNMELLMAAVQSNSNPGILGAPPPQLNPALINTLNAFNQQQLNQSPSRFPRNELPDQQTAFKQFRGNPPRFSNDFNNFGQRPFSPRNRGGFNGTQGTRFNIPNLNQPPPNIADLSGQPLRFNGPPPNNPQNSIRPQVVPPNFAQLQHSFNTSIPPPTLPTHNSSDEPMDIASPDGPPGI